MSGEVVIPAVTVYRLLHGLVPVLVRIIERLTTVVDSFKLPDLDNVSHASQLLYRDISSLPTVLFLHITKTNVYC